VFYISFCLDKTHILIIIEISWRTN